MIFDFHTHILPGIDDGSKSVEMSREMLEESSRQGIDVILTTPHFYADSMGIDSFLSNRDEAFNKVVPIAEELGIKLIPGGEIAFFDNMSRASDLDKLMIEGTDLMLLEMPFRSWHSSDLYEVDQIIRRGITPIIAHVERFFHFQRDKHIVEDLMEREVIVQVNAECLIERSTRRLGVKLFKSGYAELLGSDCHNLTSRRQNLAEGRRILDKKIGRGILEDIDQLGENVLWSCLQ